MSLGGMRRNAIYKVCGKEMEPGVLNTFASWDYFLPSDAPKLKWHTTRGIEKRGGIVLKDFYTSP